MISSSSSFSYSSSILACLVEDKDENEDEEELIYVPLISRACVDWLGRTKQSREKLRSDFSPRISALSASRRRRFAETSALLSAFLICCAGVPTSAGELSWQAVLAQMHLRTPVRELNRTNCVAVVLDSFASNHVVKALVFMPGATDELYLFRRARAVLTNDSSSLLDAITALTNQTYIQATFRAPFLLLHTTEDPLEPSNLLKDRATEQKLRQHRSLAYLKCDDRDWDFLQPILKHRLGIPLRPWRYSNQSWHFYRHSFVAWNVNGLEALELAAFAGKSKFTLRRGEAIFEVDPRVRAAPKFDAHLR